MSECYVVKRNGKYLQRPVRGYTKRASWVKSGGSSFRNPNDAVSWATAHNGTVFIKTREIPSGTLTEREFTP